MAKIYKIVCEDTTEECGLANVATEECELIVTVYESDDGRWLVQAVAEEISTRQGDGWYDFLDVLHDEDAPADGGVFDDDEGWTFEKMPDAMFFSVHLAKELGAKIKRIFACGG